ncbi:Alkaline phosphatase D [Alcanivorax sp. ALC70]|nr:Alkaline phosphatase D [Alcanivorax sp. ALC70]
MPRVRFEHGVASGDPLADRVILWTRLTLENNTPEEGAPESVPVTVTLARDLAFNQPVTRLETSTSAATDYCVKVDADGLEAGRWYYYRFQVGDRVSPVGRTRTLPAANRFVDRARFAVVSCANISHGYFSVYKTLAEHGDLDFVLHLGITSTNTASASTATCPTGTRSRPTRWSPWTITGAATLSTRATRICGRCMLSTR